jgi:hypothetical protein
MFLPPLSVQADGTVAYDIMTLASKVHSVKKVKWLLIARLYLSFLDKSGP